jgi:hypothetical protein
MCRKGLGLRPARKAALLRQLATAQAAQLRQHAPDPVHRLAPGPQFGKRTGIPALLREDEAFQLVMRFGGYGPQSRIQCRRCPRQALGDAPTR